MKVALKIVFMTTILLFLTFSSAAADWEKTLGGKYDDWALDIQPTSDGGYIITGWTVSYTGSKDLWLVKTDRDGNEQWSASHGGFDKQKGWSVVETGDGEYVAAGEIYDEWQGLGIWSLDVWLIKTAGSLHMQWARNLGGPYDDSARSVKHAHDGGYVIAGYTESYGAGGADVWLIKTNNDGYSQWTRTFGGSGDDWGHSLEPTSDGGYILVGFTESSGAGGKDVFLVKTDGAGNKEWSRTFGEEGDDIGRCVRQTSDGGYIIAGETYAEGGPWIVPPADALLIKTDSSGNVQWKKLIGDNVNDDEAGSVRQTLDGGYVIAGYREAAGYDLETGDAWILKTDALGNEEWSKTFGGSKWDWVYGVQQASDKGYILIGTTCSSGQGTRSDGWLVKAFPPELTEIRLLSPPRFVFLVSPPTFTWNSNGGTDNVFAVDFALSSDGRIYSTYEDLHIIIDKPTWTMPREIWNLIPSGTYVAWRVRGLDSKHEPLKVVTSRQVRFFYKW